MDDPDGAERRRFQRGYRKVMGRRREIAAQREARSYARSLLAFTTLQVEDPTGGEIGERPNGDVVIELRLRIRRDDLERWRVACALRKDAS